MRRLIYNSVKCLVCEITLVSTHRHDYNKCGCENNVSIDGGLDYCKVGALNIKMVEDKCIYSDSPFEVIREFLIIGSNDEKKYVPISQLSLTRLRFISDSDIDSYEYGSKKYIQMEIEWRRDNKINKIINEKVSRM